MTDTTLDALLEAVRFLLAIQNTTIIPSKAVIPLIDTLQKIDALIAQRKGRE